jgi:hypothetical protein
MGVADVIASRRAFATDFTITGHDVFSWKKLSFSQKAAKTTFRAL